MSAVAEILRDNNIDLLDIKPGQHYTICPECTHKRKKEHQREKKLGVKIDSSGVCWRCNHCDWQGGEFQGKKYTAVYSYHDADGKLLWQKLRTPPGSSQKFTQRRPDGKSNWVWKEVRKGLPSVLYRLPEVNAAINAGQEIVVVEGEKDADNLWRLGIPATCSPDGAAKPDQKPKWNAGHSAQLQGADLVILCDHDASGYAHQGVTARLSVGVARRVRILKLAEHWPECSEGDDVSDWLKAGHTPEELLALIAAAPEYESSATGDDKEIGADESLSREDFHAYMPSHNYIYVPTREMWPAASVNARIAPIPLLKADGSPALDDKGKPRLQKANAWLDQNRAVEQMTWAPGMPMLILDRLVSEGGWIERKGDTCFNLYQPPTLELGNASKAEPWLDHVHKVFDDDAEHIIKWCAHRVQRPQDKINHALVLGSNGQGTGKDTALEPVKRAVGPWNFQEISPPQILGRFNGYLKRVILRVNEVRDLGDVNRYQFYDHMKLYTAAPPDVLRVDEKNLREHSVFNCVGIILTSNYKTNGLYLPAEDRRHFVAWSARVPEDFAKNYFNELWKWYDTDGDRHVAAYLATLDLSSFDPKAPPPKTPAFWDIVDANRASEDTELADVLDLLANPPAVMISEVVAKAHSSFAHSSFAEWLRDRKNRRLLPFRFEKCGYVPVRNPAEKRDGSWKIAGTRQTIYAQSNLPLKDQLAAANELIERMRPRGQSQDQLSLHDP